MCIKHYHHKWLSKKSYFMHHRLWHCHHSRLWWCNIHSLCRLWCQCSPNSHLSSWSSMQIHPTIQIPLPYTHYISCLPLLYSPPHIALPPLILQQPPVILEQFANPFTTVQLMMLPPQHHHILSCSCVLSIQCNNNLSSWNTWHLHYLHNWMSHYPCLR